MSVTIIYELSRNGIPFYIGKSLNPKTRISRHRKNFGKFDITYIDYIPTNEWKFWEEFYINQYKCWGFTLENRNNGGGGPTYQSVETRQKLQKPKTEEHKAKLGKHLLGIKRNITWKVGRKKGQKSNYDYSKRVLDYSKVGAKGKTLLQYDLEGNLVKKWKHKNQVTQELGYNKVSIGMVCRGKQKSYKGFIWRYE